jgi:squalene monooxygenase
LADPSPVLLYPISSTEVRCLVDVPSRRKLPSVANGEMAEYLKTVIAPQVVLHSFLIRLFPATFTLMGQNADASILL